MLQTYNASNTIHQGDVGKISRGIFAKWSSLISGADLGIVIIGLGNGDVLRVPV